MNKLYCKKCKKNVDYYKCGFGSIGGLTGNGRYECKKCRTELETKSNFGLVLSILFIVLISVIGFVSADVIISDYNTNNIITSNSSIMLPYNISLSSSSTTTYSLCYQETANESTACGGLATGIYEFAGTWLDSLNLLYDGNWSTHSDVDSSADMYINYSKPTNSVGAIWQGRGYSAFNNATISQTCWNKYSDVIELKSHSEFNVGDYFQLNCYNGTGWEVLTQVPDQGARMYEEGIYWNISNTTTITDTLNNITWHWNGENYSLYDSSLKAFYNFNNFSSLGENQSLIADLSIYSNNATLLNESGYTIGRNGMGVMFTGNNFSSGDRQFFRTNNMPFNITSDANWTFSLWILPYTTYHTDVNEVVDFGENSFNRITYNDGGTVIFNTHNETGGSSSDKLISASLTIGSWSNIIVKVQDKQFYLYVNGKLKSSSTFTGTLVNSGRFRFGSRSEYPQYNYLIMNGSIDDVMGWNRSLTDNEINQVYELLLTKYDYQNWSVGINQSLTAGIKSNYKLCSSNSTQEICSNENEVTRNPINIVASFNNLVGTINQNFYGLNYHSCWFTGCADITLNNGTTKDENLSWHRSMLNQLGPKLEMRNDMSLGGYYNGICNTGFEFDWRNISAFTTISGGTNIIRCFGVGITGAGNGNYTQVTADVHTGQYSMNMTNNGTSGSVYLYKDSIYLTPGNYNLSLWIKTSNNTALYMQKTVGSYPNVCLNSVGGSTYSGSGSWQQISCNFSIYSYNSSEAYRIVIGDLGAGETMLFDDVLLNKNDAPYTWWRIGNITNLYNDYQYNHAMGYRSLEIESYMPSFLANTTSGCLLNGSNGDSRCSPTDYSILANITIDYYDRITGCEGNQTCRNNIDDIDNEVWNEPYGGFLLDYGPNNNRTDPEYGIDGTEKARQYMLMYNASYYGLKEAYPKISVGGPSGNIAYSYSPILFDSFLGNFSQQMDFLSWHPYNSYYGNGFMNSSISGLLDRCTFYNANCTRMIASEWSSNGGRMSNSTSTGLFASYNIFNNITDWNWLETDNLNAYMQQLNYVPNRISNTIYQWSSGKNVTYKPYTDSGLHYDMVDETDLLTYPMFNATQNIAHLCPSGTGSVYQSSSDDPTIKTVSCKDGSKKNIIIINTDTVSKNVTLSGTQLYNLTNYLTGEVYNSPTQTFNLGVVDGYEILYLTETPADVNPQINSICNQAGSNLLNGSILLGLILTIVFIATIISILILSIKGYITVDFSDMGFNAMLAGAFIILVAGLLLITISFVLNGSMCPAFGG